jgi:hypothetical protein
MCNGPLESDLHLSLLCPLAKQVWDFVLTWEHFDVNLIRSQTQPTEISSWWVEAAAKIPR